MATYNQLELASRTKTIPSPLLAGITETKRENKICDILNFNNT